MNFWLPIVLNVFIGLVIVAGVFTGFRDRFKVALIKFLGTAVAAVGGYFGALFAAKKIIEIEKVAVALETIQVSTATLRSVFFFVFFMLLFAVVCAVCAIIKHCDMYKVKKTTSNKAKARKVTGVNRKAEKAIRRAERKASKKAYKESVTFVSRFFGCVLGFLTAFIICTGFMAPVKYIFVDASTLKETYAPLAECYDKTLYGVIDKWIGYTDKLFAEKTVEVIDSEEETVDEEVETEEAGETEAE